MAASREQAQTGLAAELLVEARRRSLEKYILHEPLVVGVSGGANSLAMLHLLCRLRGKKSPSTIHVAHLNHWFRGKEARDDADFVRETASTWGLSCTVESFDVPNYARRNKLSQEDAARRVRYAFLGSIARKRGAAVAVAHNADDQVETVLMNLLRGAGTGGLGGMRMLGNLPIPVRDEALASIAPNVGGPVVLFRPLLHVWRHRVVAYCTEEGLQPRFDSTNWERTYRRNRIRHDLIPLLQMQYSLAVKDHLFNLSQIASADNELMEAIVDQEWESTSVESDGGDSVTFDRTTFVQLPEAMRRRLARRAIERVAGTLQDITFEHVKSAAGILSGDPESPGAAHLPHRVVVCVQDGRGRVSLRTATPAHYALAASEQGAWPLLNRGTEYAILSGADMALEGGWHFLAEKRAGTAEHELVDNYVSRFDADELAAHGQLVLRTRKPGDFIQPMGMSGHKSLQDLMVDAKIPRELRDSLPVIAIEGRHEVLWVPGPGGRRSRHAPISERTRHELQLRFVRD